MSRKRLLMLLLLLFAPLVEPMTGSTPLCQLNLINYFLFVLLYGVGALMARELFVRYKSYLSLALIGIAYGIFEEGLLTQSFLYPGYPDVGSLSLRVMFLGVQWMWAVKLIWLHMTISIMGVLFIAHTLFPDESNEVLLGRKGWIMSILSWVVLLGIWMSMIITRKGVYNGYDFHIMPFLFLLGCFFAFLYVAYLVRDNEVRLSELRPMPVAVYFFAGFFAQMGNVFIPDLLVAMHIGDGLVFIYQIMFFTAIMAFMRYFLLNKYVNRFRVAVFVFGNLFFFLVLQLLAKFVFHIPGMNCSLLNVLVFGLLLSLWLWRVYIGGLRNE